MRKLVFAAALLAGCPAFAADPVGTYAVRGVNPGGGAEYSGTVQVSRTGETYRVVWNVAGEQFVGTGIGNQDFLAVSYQSGKSTGLALYGAAGSDWQGTWAYAGSRATGGERWTRR